MKNRTVVIPNRVSEITQEILMINTYTMKLGDRVLNGDLGGVGAKTVTLPPVKDAAGHIFTIFGLDVIGNDLTISRNSNDAIAVNILKGIARAASYDLDADEEYAVLYSDGFHWHLIAGNVS